ncbi:MAG: flagellar biosynthetic protein FliR, partial [Planctomycetota bacterium]
VFAQLPLVAVQMAGYIMGYQMGLAIASAYNPELDTESGVIGQLLFFLAAMVFALIGGLEILFIALATTFETMPIGGFSGWAVPVEPVVDLLHTGFEFALRLSMPIMAVVMLILLAIGFGAKTMPQLNVMTVGFALKILAGIGSLAAVAMVLDAEIADELLRVLDLIFEWASNPLEAGDG